MPFVSSCSPCNCLIVCLSSCLPFHLLPSLLQSCMQLWFLKLDVDMHLLSHAACL